MITLKVKRLSATARLPKKAHDDDAAFDLYADCPSSSIYGSCEPGVIEIPPHFTVTIPTGIATELPHRYYATVYARSGLATKKGLRPANCVGVIDEGYTNQWYVALHNDSEVTQYIKHGDRIAQFTLLPVPSVNILEVDELNDTSRGMGGFGSSGV